MSGHDDWPVFRYNKLLVKGGAFMKKFLLAVVAAASILCLVGCSATSVAAIKSSIYSDEEYQAAVEVMQEYFGENFKGCTLKEVKYAGDDVVEQEAKTRGFDTDKIIVLETTFEVPEDFQGALNPGETYEGFTWTLTRPDVNGLWEHIDHGYG